MSAESPAEEAQSRRWFPPPPAITWALAIIVIVFIAYLASDVVVLFIFSAALAYVLSPLVRMAEAHAIKRKLAVTGIYLAIAVTLILLATLVLPTLRAEISNLSTGSFTKQLDQAVDSLQRDLIAQYPAMRHVLGDPEDRNERLSALVEHQMANLPNLLTHMATIVVVIVLIPVFSYFMLRDSRRMVQLFMDRLPATHIETSVAVWCEIDRIIGRYLRGLALDGLTIGTIAAVGLWLFGVNYPLLLGAFSGMANVVPYVGPFMSGTVVGVIATIQFKSLTPLVKVLLLYLGIKFFDLTVINPTTVGRSVHLHPILLVASLLIGGHAFGLIGMIIAVPTVTILQEMTRLMLEHRRRVSGRHETRRAAVPMQAYVC